MRVQLVACGVLVLALLTGLCAAAACKKDGDCDGKNDYCVKKSCDAVEGECAAKANPELCPRLYKPVCGCNGKSYDNECFAQAAGVNVASDGPCVCSTNSQCWATNTFCSKGDADCDGKGQCAVKPKNCPLFYKPVCGCDGKTYGNKCEAQSNGVNVASNGPCTCTANEDCLEKNTFCAKNDTDCKGDGKCTVMPSICPDVYKPVCGCDGKTYNNKCEAQSNGINVFSFGPCTCTDNAQCWGKGTFCEKKDADCKGNGQCEEMPTNCPKLWKPVCGCDGKTYPNKCEAQAAGVNVASNGPCVCTENSQCWEKGTFCQKGDADCKGNGECEVMPTKCTDVYRPVCGCDGNTYGNKCVAQSVGVNVAYNGPCVCTDNSQCWEKGTFCEKGDGDCKGKGECELMPTQCLSVLKPVCGCDGKTYGNKCVAQSAGVNVAYDGPCECKVNSDCPEKNMFCDKPEGKCDAAGTCTVEPTQCTDKKDPVCGCDNQTYGNACMANAAGVSILYVGECKQP